jgi:ABC-type multidrug transport system fused ATPase/permease subunit
VAEIQVSGLLARVLRRFEQRQNVRDSAALRNADVNNFNTVLQKLTFSIGFIAIIVLYVFTNLFRESGPPGASGEGTATAGLIVVLVTALPQLYFRFAELTQLLTQFQIADVSASRLRQYEASPAPVLPAHPASADAVQDGAIALRGVRYQFSGSQVVRGGPEGISCNIPPRGMTGIIGPAGAGKSTLLRLLLGRQQPLEGTIDYPGGNRGSCFVYLPQRPVLFDAQLRDNLFLSSAKADAAALVSTHERFDRLGLLDLIRQKGLEALPAEGADRGADLSAVRNRFRQAAKDELGADLAPLGPGRSTPRQMVIEGQLGCAVDQVVLAERLTSPYSREPVRGLASLRYGRDMAPHGMALLRQTAPLLAQTASADDYNRVAAVKIDPRIWELRVSALEAVMGHDGEPREHSNLPLVAIALSARIEELEADALPLPEADACVHLNRLVAGISLPLQADRLNRLLTWRENLLFAALDRANVRGLAQVDGLLLRHLRGSPLDGAVIEAGLDFSVGRLGGRLSGGQQQLIALGRALLNPAPFLMLDEPSSAFHPQLRVNLIAVLQEEARSRSVVVITHDMDIAQSCERLLFVRDGSLAGQGSWAQLVDENDDFKAWIAGRKEAP